ncbi:MAG: hypothetical protein NT031_01680, partial [Planctomycetota bacterium]|nr:hypothetical protein [Planctomycetota bacterium]
GKAIKREGGAIRGATIGHEDAIREVDPSARLGEALAPEGHRRAALEQARRNRLGELTGLARGQLADNATEDAAAVLAEILRLDPQNAWAADALARASRELRERIRPEPGGDQTNLSLRDVRESQVPWYYEIAYPADWREKVVGREGGRNENKPDGADPIVERAYDIRDMLVTVPNFIGQQVNATMHDQSVQGTDFFGDAKANAAPIQDVGQRRKAAEKVARTIQSAVDPASWRELERAVGGAIQISNGQLIVRQREDNQKKIANLLGQLREARGARVQEGEKLLTQAANVGGNNGDAEFNYTGRASDGVININSAPVSMIGGNSGWVSAGRTGSQAGEALANDPEFRKFVEDNYAWANDRNGRAGQTPASQPATLAYDNNDLAQRLLTNKGQKTNVTSWNVKVDERAAASLGLKFNAGNNDVRYTVVDEAQLRTLAELEASRG